MAKISRIFLVCGEPSGDLHAAALASALKQINPEIHLLGVGGALLREAGAEICYDIKALAVFGLFDVLKKLPRFFALKKIILKKIRETQPDAVILIDFSGFNLRLAKAINKTRPAIYYISPQVWASRPGRIQTIKKYIHKIIVFFKFEEEFYKKYGINADCLGHPLLDIVKPSQVKQEFLAEYNLSQNKTIIALLPGSRKQEITNILPIMLETACLLDEKIGNLEFIIAKAPAVEEEIYERQIQKFSLDLKIIEGKTYDCINAADFCLVCSGTATLETAIIEKPFVIIYKMSALNYLLYRPQVKVPYIGMVNIVAGRKIIPEFIQLQAKPKKIAETVINILGDRAKIERINNELSRVKSALGEKGAALRAAQSIISFLEKQ